MTGLTLTRDEALASDPRELLARLSREVTFTEIAGINAPDDMAAVQDELNRCTAYICFFTELETAARVEKRVAKAQHQPNRAERLLGVEDVLGAYREIARQRYEYVSKLMTAKRLMLDEARIMSSQT